MLVSVSNIDIRLILYKLCVLQIGWLHSYLDSSLCAEVWVAGGGIHHTMVSPPLYLFLNIITSSFATRKLYCVYRAQVNLMHSTGGVSFHITLKTTPVVDTRTFQTRSSLLLAPHSLTHNYGGYK